MSDASTDGGEPDDLDPNDPDRLTDYLRQMIEASRDAIAFTDGMDRTAFLADLRTQRAVVMSLMIVGEAAARIVADYPKFASRRPDIPWRSMRGMRNRIAHGYFEVDLGVVWETVRTELPLLLARLKNDQG